MYKTAVVTSVAILVYVVAALVGCNSTSNPSSMTGPAPPPPPPPANTVAIANFAFNPSSITVRANTTITWKNNDGVAHTATADNGAWDTGSIPSGGSASVTFANGGTFSYHCAIHPMMRASVTVQ